MKRLVELSTILMTFASFSAFSMGGGASWRLTYGAASQDNDRRAPVSSNSQVNPSGEGRSSPENLRRTFLSTLNISSPESEDENSDENDEAENPESFLRTLNISGCNSPSNERNADFLSTLNITGQLDSREEELILKTRFVFLRAMLLLTSKTNNNQIVENHVPLEILRISWRDYLDCYNRREATDFDHIDRLYNCLKEKLDEYVEVEAYSNLFDTVMLANTDYDNDKSTSWKKRFLSRRVDKIFSLFDGRIKESINEHRAFYDFPLIFDFVVINFEKWGDSYSGLLLNNSLPFSLSPKDMVELMTFANSTGIMFQSFAHCHNDRAECINAMFLQMFNEFGDPLLGDLPYEISYREENNEELILKTRFVFLRAMLLLTSKTNGHQIIENHVPQEILRISWRDYLECYNGRVDDAFDRIDRLYDCLNRNLTSYVEVEAYSNLFDTVMLANTDYDNYESTSWKKRFLSSRVEGIFSLSDGNIRESINRRSAIYYWPPIFDFVVATFEKWGDSYSRLLLNNPLPFSLSSKDMVKLMTFANSTGIMFQSFAHCNNGRAEGIKAMFLQMFNEFGGPLLRDHPEENNEENNDHDGEAGNDAPQQEFPDEMI